MRSNLTQQQQAIYRQYPKRFFYGNTHFIYEIPNTNSAKILSAFGITKAQKAMQLFRNALSIFLSYA